MVVFILYFINGILIVLLCTFYLYLYAWGTCCYCYVIVLCQCCQCCLCVICHSFYLQPNLPLGTKKVPYLRVARQNVCHCILLPSLYKVSTHNSRGGAGSGAGSAASGHSSSAAPAWTPLFHSAPDSASSSLSTSSSSSPSFLQFLRWRRSTHYSNQMWGTNVVPPEYLGYGLESVDQKRGVAIPFSIAKQDFSIAFLLLASHQASTHPHSPPTKHETPLK